MSSYLLALFACSSGLSDPRCGTGMPVEVKIVILVTKEASLEEHVFRGSAIKAKAPEGKMSDRVKIGRTKHGHVAQRSAHIVAKENTRTNCSASRTRIKEASNIQMFRFQFVLDLREITSPPTGSRSCVSKSRSHNMSKSPLYPTLLPSGSMNVMPSQPRRRVAAMGGKQIYPDSCPCRVG